MALSKILNPLGHVAPQVVLTVGKFDVDGAGAPLLDTVEYRNDGFPANSGIRVTQTAVGAYVVSLPGSTGGPPSSSEGATVPSAFASCSGTLAVAQAHQTFLASVGTLTITTRLSTTGALTNFANATISFYAWVLRTGAADTVPLRSNSLGKGSHLLANDNELITLVGHFDTDAADATVIAQTTARGLTVARTGVGVYEVTIAGSGAHRILHAAANNSDNVEGFQVEIDEANRKFTITSNTGSEAQSSRVSILAVVKNSNSRSR